MTGSHGRQEILHHLPHHPARSRRRVDYRPGAEWARGDAEKAQALAIFDAHPELHKDMRYLAHGFLWSLESVRPSAKETQP